MKKRTYRIHVKGANKVKNIGNNVAEQRQFHKTQETLHWRLEEFDARMSLKVAKNPKPQKSRTSQVGIEKKASV